ncbi:two-component system cell cycle response regulator [Paenibacillus shirakamiensis]|uniref:Two-component system cell cycle response regulator n=1 Tax=Paenibacillus shirakamiensis TaxID=1265935 RepID=A0ABS4JFJ1_9BACL|nr:GGDEF domain-containing protein [Paenibacillus shirakamiensis]MBP2000473.1 two-component system cell cycle response regulator [Paenibacillus shirakamiensis]
MSSNADWTRKFMNGYWWSAVVLLAAEVIYMIPNVRITSPFAVELIVGLDLLILFILKYTEWKIWKGTVSHRNLLISGVCISDLGFFVMMPYIDVAQLILLIPIMLSLVFFDLTMLYVAGWTSIIIYTLVFISSHRVHETEGWLGWLLVIALIVLGVKVGHAVLMRSREMTHHMESLVQSEQKLIVENVISDKLLKIDALTGLYNQKTFHEYLDSLIEHCETSGIPVQLALLDIDNFKQINDTLGHWVGDIVLKEVAGKITDLLNPNDFAVRYGGEEFAVIFTDTSNEEACAQAEKIRMGIQNLPFAGTQGQPITISIGICSYLPGDGKEQFFRKADDALYKAKRTGKNKVVYA